MSLPPKHSPTGQRKRLFFDTEKEAKARAAALLDVRSPLPAWAAAVDPVLIAQAVKYDGLVREYGFHGLTDFMEKQLRAVERALQSPHLSELLDAYEKDNEKNWSGDYLRKRWKPFRKRLAEVEEVRLSQLTEDAWRAWLTNWREEAAPGPTTYNQQLGMIRSLFELRAAKVIHPINPLGDLPSMKTDDSEVAVFSVSDCRKLLLTAWEHDRDLVPPLAVMLFTGVRPDSELLRMNFEDLQWADNHVVVEVSKTRGAKRRHVEIEDALRAWLAPWARSTGSIVPPDWNRRRRYLVRGFHTTPGAVKMDPTTWTPLVTWAHDITRHTYGSYWEAAHRSQPGCRERLAANMGHRDYKTFESHYRNGRSPAEAAEFWKIDPP